MAPYKFVPYFLSPVKTRKVLDKIATVDLETSSWLDDAYKKNEDWVIERYHNRPIVPFLVTYWDGVHLRQYDGDRCVKDFLKDHLTFKNRGIITFAHNGGKFDFNGLYHAYVTDDFLKDHFTIKPLVSHGRILCLKFHDLSKKNMWEFRDSFSLLPKSLASLCESFKPLHMKLEMPKTTYKKDPETWKRYNANDCYSLYEILQKFSSVIADVGGSIGLTTAGTAMATFRKRFLKQDIPTYFAYNTFYRENAYYGGRTETFVLHAPKTGQPYYDYDVNSMYPYVMRENKFPTGRPVSVRYTDADECKGKCGIMECEVQTPPDMDIPLLPYRDPLYRKLLFPLGTWKACYEFSFIEKAIDYGYHIKPLRTWEFEEEKQLFKDYIDYFYEIRMQSQTKGEKDIYKLMMNSLYGKFAERSKRQELITDPDADITGLYPYDTFFGYCIREYERFSSYHLPAISIRVTALAQLRLFDYMEQIQKTYGGRILYCDTDSIMTDVRIPTSERLGDLKVECDFIRGVFPSQKLYMLDTYEQGKRIVKMKGFSRSFQRHMQDYETWEEALLTGDWSKFREVQVRVASINEIRVRNLDGFTTLVQPRAVRGLTEKREILPDYNTKPLHVTDGEVKYKAPVEFDDIDPGQDEDEVDYRRPTI